MVSSHAIIRHYQLDSASQLFWRRHTLFMKLVICLPPPHRASVPQSHRLGELYWASTGVVKVVFVIYRLYQLPASYMSCHNFCDTDICRHVQYTMSLETPTGSLFRCAYTRVCSWRPTRADILGQAILLVPNLALSYYARLL